MPKSAREGALLTLNDIEKNKAYSNLAGQSYYKELSKQDKALMTELVMGVVRHKLYLDYCIKKLSSIKINKISQSVINILRLGIYQIEFLDKIPPSAAVNECVKLAKKYEYEASGFVNAVLRNYLRKRDGILDKNLPFEEFLSIKYSYPLWMVKRFVKIFGEGAREFLSASNQVAPIFVRKNTLVCDDLPQDKFSKTDLLPETYVLNKGISVHEDEDFAEGKYIVQDAASQMVAAALCPKKGQRVLDMCAAPGGKTTHIAALMENAGEVIAWDIHQSRIKLIGDNAKRLKIDIIKTYEKDASVYDENLKDSFDAVLVDAPCSGLGIIRRKPDIKWNRKEEDISGLVSLQKSLLDNAAKYVKPGGVLVYSTCTLLEEENLGQVEDFLKGHPDFYLCEINLPIEKPTLKEGYVNLYPHIDNTDGFFICKMIKRC